MCDRGRSSDAVHRALSDAGRCGQLGRSVTLHFWPKVVRVFYCGVPVPDQSLNSPKFPIYFISASFERHYVVSVFYHQNHFGDNKAHHSFALIGGHVFLTVLLFVRFFFRFHVQ